MKQTAQWYREQSALAEREWQRAVWGRAAPHESSPQSAAGRIYPHLHQKVESAPPARLAADNTVASRIYPHLRGK